MWKQYIRIALYIIIVVVLPSCGIRDIGSSNSTKGNMAVEHVEVPELATNCFNETLGKSGARYRMRFRGFTPGIHQGQIVTADINFTTSHSNAVDGKILTIIVAKGNVASKDHVVQLVQKNYFRIDLQKPEIQLMKTELKRGRETHGANGDAVNVVTTYTPGRRFRFDLKPGESYKQAYTRIIVRMDGNRVIDRSTADVKSSITFEGMDLTSGPSGRHDACRFREVRSIGNGSTTKFTYWIDMPYGLALHEREETDAGIVRESILLEAAVNGVGVRGR